jgi:hypothetical protein
MPKPDWIYADFNGLLGRDLLCISHGDTARNYAGELVQLSPGMKITRYDEDADEQNFPDAILATGVVEPTPPSARCRGSKWSLRIDADGIRHESELPAGATDI